MNKNIHFNWHKSSNSIWNQSSIHQRFLLLMWEPKMRVWIAKEIIFQGRTIGWDTAEDNTNSIHTKLKMIVVSFWSMHFFPLSKNSWVLAKYQHENKKSPLKSMQMRCEAAHILFYRWRLMYENQNVCTWQIQKYK